MAKKQKHPEKPAPTVIVIGPMDFDWRSLGPFLKRSSLSLVFLDGGLVHRDKFKKKFPTLVKNSISAGDGDSSRQSMTLNKTDQNHSDLAFYLKTIPKNLQVKSFIFAGFLGGRIDHQLFNLGELTHFLNQFKIKKLRPQILLEDKIELLGPGKHEREVIGTFSLGCLEENRIKISGNCEFPTKSWINLSTLSSRGLSNVGHGKIVIETKKALMLFYAKKK